MEADSKKRGRPPVFSDEHLSFLATIYPETKTKRALQNKAYMTIGLGVIGKGKEPEYDWLFSEKEKTIRESVLAELGRLSMVAGGEYARKSASMLCGMDPKPTTRQAAIRISQVRQGKDGAGNMNSFAYEVLNLIDDYLSRYPNTPISDVKKTLARVVDIIR